MLTITYSWDEQIWGQARFTRGDYTKRIIQLVGAEVLRWARELSTSSKQVACGGRQSVWQAG